MKILHVTSAGIGGAWTAARRLHDALRKSGIDSHMVVRTKKSTEQAAMDKSAIASCDVCPTGIENRKRVLSTLCHLLEWSERIQIRGRGWLGYRITQMLGMEGCSLNTFRTGLHRILNDSNADVIHLHWINDEMISIKEIAKINKPIVWTLHDMWPLCGAEHFPGWAMKQRIDRKTIERAWCELMSNSPAAETRGLMPDDSVNPDEENDVKFSGIARVEQSIACAVNSWILKEKRRAWRNISISFVAPSDWMANQVVQSSLFSESRVTVVPNVLDTDIFKPLGKKDCRERHGIAREKRIILFCAHNPLDINKGMDLLHGALRMLSKSIRDSVEVVVVGNTYGENIGGLPTQWMGKIMNEKVMAEIYSAADVTCVPSRIETFPNVIAESMACGTPCVAFYTGGIPSMIEHQVTGWMAEPFDTLNYKNGLEWVFGEIRTTGDSSAASDMSTIGINCRSYAQRRLSAHAVIPKITDIYKNLNSARSAT